MEDGVVNLQNDIVDQKEDYDDAVEKLNKAFDRRAFEIKVKREPYKFRAFDI